MRVNRGVCYGSAIMLSLVDEEPVPYFRSSEQWKVLESRMRIEQAALVKESREMETYKGRFKPGTSAQEVADRLFDELQRMRLRNPAWWAMEGTQYYAALLRWYRADAKEPETAGAKPTDGLARLGTCYYQLHMFPEWEQCQKQRGLTTAREIEKALRWDGKTYSNQGKGYAIVTQYLTQKRAGTDKQDRGE